MSERNGDRARFQKDRRRKLRRRQRIQALMIAVRKRTDAANPSAGRGIDEPSHEASLAVHDEGGPMRAGG